MAVHLGNPIPHLVVDSVAFLKRARLETFGSKVYTTTEVIRELRDPQIRAALKSLPYVLHLEEPSKEAIKIVSEMSKRTGDYSVLSATDVGLIALTYELHKTHVGEPVEKPIVSSLGFRPTTPSQIPLSTDLGVQARLCMPDSKDSDASSSATSDADTTEDEDDDDAEPELADDGDNEIPSADDWISEHNFEQKAAENFGFGGKFRCQEPSSVHETSPPVVACLTTDFAMQNVLFHLGLELVSLCGMKITRPRTHLLWCGSCFRPTKRTDTYFCPSCAQANLRRIPVTLMEDGQLQFHFSRRFIKSLRGSKQPIRKPRGGKYADEPIYCPDQRLPDRRPAKQKHPDVQPIATNGMLEDLCDLDELCQQLDNSGFSAFPLHDVTSRSARMGIRSDHQVPTRSWHRPKAEHGLKPSRGTAHLTKPRTGNKKKKKQSKL
ncbi:RNA-binding protein NOB1 [Clonorchis sinensis]|uniref:RNA-binding protein NOB1 n=1 Tax=Clonorchis sinensis TaxID=79923 RepID=H2KS07_CLOSI|nr:RNA-binding protein NOB1 [Clonorchis sinensis]